MTDGKYIEPENKKCPFCDRHYGRIVDRDNEIALLECEKLHQWSVILKEE
jgi:hypothetical protein